MQCVAQTLLIFDSTYIKWSSYPLLKNNFTVDSLKTVGISRYDNLWGMHFAPKRFVFRSWSLWKVLHKYCKRFWRKSLFLRKPLTKRDWKACFFKSDNTDYCWFEHISTWRRSVQIFRQIHHSILIPKKNWSLDQLFLNTCSTYSSSVCLTCVPRSDLDIFN